MVMVRGQQALLEQSVCLIFMESRTAGCERKVCACWLWRVEQQAVVSARFLPSGYGERTAGSVRAKCVSDFYGEQDSRL